MGYCLGVDLGTTYTAAAILRGGRAEMAVLGTRTAAVPTMVFVPGDAEPLVGEAARRRLPSDPARVAREFKRRLGDSAPIFIDGTPRSAESLLALVLRWVVERVSEQEGGPPDAIVLTHPANWGPYRRELFAQAIQLAGVPTATTLSEPEAAAAYYASTERLQPGDVVAVYDLGGGTFDAAVLRRTPSSFEVLGSPEGLEHLGGADIDEAVFEHVKQALGGVVGALDGDDPASVRALRHLRAECAEAKEALSFDATATIPVLLPGAQTEVILTRAELERMIRPLLTDTISFLRLALTSAHIEPGDLRSVLLVGGSSRIPLVAEMIGAELGRPVAVDAHPKHAVALGAALTAAHDHVPADVAVAPTEVPPVPADVPAEDGGGEPPTPPKPAEPPVPPEPVAEPAEPVEAAPTLAPLVPKARRRPNRRVLTALVAGVLVVGGLTALYLGTRGDDVVETGGNDGDDDGDTTGGVVDKGDLWATSVADTGGVIRIDRASGGLLDTIPIEHITEEAVVTDEFVWIGSDDPVDGAVVHQLDRDDPHVIRRLPLDVADPRGIEILRTGDGVWVLVAPTSGPALAARIDPDGGIAARAEVPDTVPSVEPVSDGERLFVPTTDGVTRVDPDGTLTPGSVPAPAGGGGAPAFSVGRLFVLRNDAVHELDPDTMEVTNSAPYSADDDPGPLFEDGDETGIHIEEVYGTEAELTFLASDLPMAEGTFFFRVDADDGAVLTRVRLPGDQSSGVYDLRPTEGDLFWGYLSTGTAALLRIDADGRIEEFELPPRSPTLDPDLVTNGGRLIVTDVDLDAEPVVHVVDPATGELESTLGFPT